MFNNNYTTNKRSSGFRSSGSASSSFSRSSVRKPNFTTYKPGGFKTRTSTAIARPGGFAPRSRFGDNNSSNRQSPQGGSNFRGGGGAFQGNSRGYSSGPSRPSFGYGRPSGPRRQIRFFSDINKFVKKADPQPNIEDVITQHTFADFGFSKPVQENIIQRGYTNPTPIQDQAIKPIIEGRDVIGLANTGTGKTAAFLLPIIDNIFQNRDKKALIIAPTRELALQINTEFRNFAQGLRVYSAIVTGGAPMGRQVFELRRNPHVVIATPGRLKDLIRQNVLNLKDFSIFVLDEVDLMVDIGFIDDIREFISQLPEVRQSLFFSATISPKVHDILARFVKNPITVSVKKQDTANNVDQDVIKIINRDKKVDQLHDLLIKDGFDKVMIFGRTKHGVENLYKELEHRGFKVGAIHGNKNQGARKRVLESFKQDHIKILLATDVASRGLDIDNVTHVINYELPETYEDYIHRIGRTGRANKTGIALTFID